MVLRPRTLLATTLTAAVIIAGCSSAAQGPSVSASDPDTAAATTATPTDLDSPSPASDTGSTPTQTATSTPSDATSEAEEPTASPPSATPSAPTSDTTPRAAAPTLTIMDFDFDEPTTVSPGAQVTVDNRDEVLHTVTADDGSFDIQVKSGDTDTITAPSTPGGYAFVCELHANMSATLTVE